MFLIDMFLLETLFIDVVLDYINRKMVCICKLINVAWYFTISFMKLVEALI